MAVATVHVLSADIAMQPLDLSIRPRREKHWSPQLDILEHGQADVTTACKFNTASAGSERLSPCIDPKDSNRRHQHAGLLSSLLSNTDLTFYTGRQISSSTYSFRGNHQRKSPYHLPLRQRLEMCQENSFVEQSSGNSDEVCSSRDFAASCCQHPGCGVCSQLQTSSSPQDPTDYHSNVKLPPFATTSLTVTSSDCQSGNSPLYSQWETTEMDSMCREISEDMRQFSCHPYNPIQQHFKCRDTISNKLAEKSVIGYEGFKSFRADTHKTSFFLESQKTPPGNRQKQLSTPGSPDLVSSSTPCPWGVYSENMPPSFSKPAGELKHSKRLLVQPGVYTHLEMRTQLVPCYTEATRLNQPAMSSLPSKDNTRWKQRLGDKPASLTPTDCNQVSTTTDTVSITDNRYKTLKYSTEANLRHRSSPDKISSTQVSILDFWISKFLAEPSVETPSREKPCHVEYICSEAGQKKIRFRLVDLMELQVEQSLMA